MSPADSLAQAIQVLTTQLAALQAGEAIRTGQPSLPASYLAMRGDALLTAFLTACEEGDGENILKLAVAILTTTDEPRLRASFDQIRAGGRLKGVKKLPEK